MNTKLILEASGLLIFYVNSKQILSLISLVGSQFKWQLVDTLEFNSSVKLQGC